MFFIIQNPLMVSSNRRKNLWSKSLRYFLWRKEKNYQSGKTYITADDSDADAAEEELGVSFSPGEISHCPDGGRNAFRRAPENDRTGGENEEF